MALEQRVPGEADAPGSQVDPVETPITVAGIEDVPSLPDGLFSPEEEDVSAMEEAGFVAGLVDTCTSTSTDSRRGGPTPASLNVPL